MENFNNKKYRIVGIFMKVIKVKNKKDMRSFVYLPKILHGENVCYVPPIWMDEKRAYHKKANPILKNSDFELFLALDDEGTPIGRTISYIDFKFNDYYKVEMGLFGALELRTKAELFNLDESFAICNLHYEGLFSYCQRRFERKSRRKNSIT